MCSTVTKSCHKVFAQSIYFLKAYQPLANGFIFTCLKKKLQLWWHFIREMTEVAEFLYKGNY